MEYLNVSRQPLHDTSVSKFEYHTYSPLFQNSYGRSDEIRIPIANQDSFILPHKSFLYIELKIDNAIVPDTLTLTKNFVMFMFDEMRIELNGIPIETVRNPGLVSTMKYFLTMDRNEYCNAGKYDWMQDGGLKVAKDKDLNFIIPCKNLMGFFDDLKNV